MTISFRSRSRLIWAVTAGAGLGLAMVASLFLDKPLPTHPLEAVQSATPLAAFDEAYWISLASSRPEDWQQCLTYCAQHRANRPNCEPLLRTSWSAELERAGRGARQYLNHPTPMTSPRTPFASPSRQAPMPNQEP